MEIDHTPLCLLIRLSFLVSSVVLESTTKRIQLGARTTKQKGKAAKEKEKGTLMS